MSFRVNLALAYTELTEELGRLRELSSLQGRIDPRHLTSLLPEGEVLRSHPERAQGGRELFISLAVVFLFGWGAPQACGGSGAAAGTVMLSRQRSTE